MDLVRNATRPEGWERREFQRLQLVPPLSGTFGTTPVTILEAGVLGARIEHAATLDANRGDLRFSFDDNQIVIRCEVVRTAERAGRAVSGVRFVAAVDESGDHLRNMLAQLVERALEARNEATAATRLHLRVVDGDKTVRGADAHFVSYRLENGTWRKRPVFLPEQPAVGFTVARGEDEEEMHRLCDVYVASDDEGRRLIRLFAELSVSLALQIPPRA